ncbi:hypothetical protein C8R42DRAFT_691179 [Lentinula raphanica]|nr:hypothetical protein C8R42DRAFT_691179 [Lentinula raphanica]
MLLLLWQCCHIVSFCVDSCCKQLVAFFSSLLQVGKQCLSAWLCLANSAVQLEVTLLPALGHQLLVTALTLLRAFSKS